MFYRLKFTLFAARSTPRESSQISAFGAFILSGLWVLLQPIGLYAQESSIQWASSVDYEFNLMNEGGWSAMGVLGAPNAFPAGSLSPNALRLASEREFGKVVLQFDEPQPVSQLFIVENYHPGRVIKVVFIDDGGQRYVVYQAEPEHRSEDFRTFMLSVERTPYKVHGVELNINSIMAPGWPQIDAVGLLDMEDPQEARNLLRGANFNLSEGVPFTAKKEILGPSVNSPAGELKPLISKSGDIMYFCRLNHKHNTGGRSDPQDIYFARAIGDGWSEAENLGAPLNNAYENGVCSISPDGQSLLLINSYPELSRSSQALAVSYARDGGWSKPEAVVIEEYRNNSLYRDFFLADDESFILIAMENEQGRGDLDLFVSLQIDKHRYAKPISLGTRINTTKADFAPFMSSDGKTLYFASEGHRGYGESDIFRSRRLDDTWDNWSPPENLGPSVNTAKWEGYFSIVGSHNYAYFVSTNGTKREDENIYRIRLMDEEPIARAVPLIALSGEVVERRIGTALAARVRFEGDSSVYRFQSTADNRGKYNIYLPVGQHYTVKAEAEGYIPATAEVDLRDRTADERITLNFELLALKLGQILTLDAIYFEQSKAAMLEESHPTLSQLVDLMRGNPSLMIELIGHTDRQGSPEENMRLSQQRVETIKSYLVSNNIAGDRIQTRGMGGTEPIAPNDTEDNRARNRRVEMKVLSY